MAEAKTKPTKASVTRFLKDTVEGERHADCHKLVKMMRAATGAKPVMWGPNIVGFGTTPLAYANGETADWPTIAFAPRKQNLVLYGLNGFSGAAELLRKLGKHKTSKACLYVKRLVDIDLDVLAELMERGVAAAEEKQC